MAYENIQLIYKGATYKTRVINCTKVLGSKNYHILEYPITRVKFYPEEMNTVKEF